MPISRRSSAPREANFARTIDAGMNILNNMIDGLEKAHQHLLKGLDVFKLNDTFGFPPRPDQGDRCRAGH